MKRCSAWGWNTAGQRPTIWCVLTAGQPMKRSSTSRRGSSWARARSRTATQQGGNADSTWTRGLAWALYGFTTAHRLASGGCEPPGALLEVVRRCADCYLRRAPAGLVPPWDFDLPDDVPHLWDSSAAAIPAS